MKICVAGLGLIGGSVCMSLKRAGYAVDGWNRSPQPLQYALQNGIIDKASHDFCGKAAAYGFSYFNLLTIDKNLFIMS